MRTDKESVVSDVYETLMSCMRGTDVQWRQRVRAGDISRRCWRLYRLLPDTAI